MSVVEAIKHYQRSIDKCEGNEPRMLHCISKLYNLPVTVQHLQDTGIGRTVNNLRRYDGDTGDAAKALIAKWKAMVAAEDSSEGEEAEAEAEENHQNSTEEEERSPPKREERHRSKEKSRHEKKHHSDERSKKPSSHEQIKKRKYEEENVKKSDKRRRRHETESESSESEEDSSHVEEDDNEHDSEDQSTSQASQNVDGDSSDEEPSYREKSHVSSKEHRSKVNSSSKEHHNKNHSSNSNSSKVHSSSKDRSSSKEHRSSSKEHRSSSKEHRSSSKEHRSSSKEHSSSSKELSSSSKEHKSNSKELSSSNKEHSSKVSSSGSNNKHHSSKDHNSHRKHKDKSEHTSENKHRKDEKRKEEPSKKPKVSSSSHIPDKKQSVKIKKEKPETEDGIDCSTGASFAEALGMVDPIVKKKTNIPTSSPGTSTSSSRSKSSTSGSSSSKKKNITSSPGELNLLSPNVKLEPLQMEVDLDATLPTITPNYKPLPHYNLLDSPPHRKMKQLTEEEALSQVMSTKNQRTKVYSGIKSNKSWATVPSLYDICVRVLQENIDALEYTGGVPYDLLKPILQHATPDQLYMLEHHNPYLIEDTGELWHFHCQKEFRTKQREDMETWREMYMRCLEEREAKLKALTTNIQQSIAKSTPVRQTKLAYVDSIAKPPRNVARQQAKYGTAKVNKPTPAAKAAARLTGIGAAPVSATRPIQTVTKAKPRMAPLMQKTMKLVKSFKR